MEKLIVLLKYILETDKMVLIKSLLPYLNKWGVMGVWIIFSTATVIFLYYTVSVNCAHIIHKKGWDGPIKKKINGFAHKTVAEIGYFGVFILVLIPLPFFRIGGMNAGEILSLRYTLHVSLLANIVRIICSTSGIFALLT